MSGSGALALVSNGSPAHTPTFTGAPAATWFGTYVPSEKKLVLHFRRDLQENITRVTKMRRATEDDGIVTGAYWYTLDGMPCTLENIRQMKSFTVLLSTYHLGPGYGEWIKGHENIKPFEQLLRNLGDDVGAQQVRETFPKIFETPARQVQPEPQPAPQMQKRRPWWRRRF